MTMTESQQERLVKLAVAFIEHAGFLMHAAAEGDVPAAVLSCQILGQLDIDVARVLSEGAARSYVVVEAPEGKM